MIRLILPIPPSTNNWVRTVNNRPILSREARAYKEACDLEFRTAIKMTPIDGPTSLRADIFRPRKAGDLSGYIKVLEDVLNGFAYRDDSQTVQIHLERWDDAKFPRVDVRIDECAHSLMPGRPVLRPDLSAAFIRIKAATEAAHAITLASQRAKRATKKTLKPLATSATYRRVK